MHKNFARAKSVLLLVLIGGIALTQTAAHKTSKVRTTAFSQDRRIISLKLNDFQREMRHLVDEGYSLAGVDLTNNIADFYVDDNASKAIRSLKASSQIVSEVPVIKAAPDASYMTPVKIETAVKKFASDYPNLAKLESVGKSLQNRDIYAIKLSSDPQGHSAQRPVVFFNAMHHAREVMTAEVGIDTIQYLLSNYGRDQKVTHWLDTMEIWVLPMFNVDGNNKVWTGDNMWRKNARGDYGVDINRNYPYAWNTCNGSSSSRFADDFRGDSAGSEPETQVMMALVNRIRPVFSISYHSYSELVIYPYGCDGQRTPNRDVVETIGAELARRLPADSGSGSYKAGTAWELLYSVDGGDIDWMFHTYDVLPYVIELNSRTAGFQPSYATLRDRTVQRVRAGWSFLLDRIDGPGIRAIVTDRRGGAITGAAMAISRTDKDAGKHEMAIKPDGSVHAVLMPGTYHVTFTAPGHDPVEKTVEVTDARVDLDIGI